MGEILKNQTLIVALISAVTSFLVFFITLISKNYIERKLISSKLNIEYKFSQQKQIKEILGLNKVQLNDACNNLKKRIGNHYRNYENGWLKRGAPSFKEHYYVSFIYRFLVFFSRIEIIERELIFLDSTVANKAELELIKYLKLFPRIMSSDYLPKLDLNGNEINDHFNRDEMSEFSALLIIDKTVMSFTQFKEFAKNEPNKFQRLYDFFENLNPIEERLKWDRIYYLQLCLSVFLNQYGYDFQETPKNKLKFYFTKPRNSCNYEDFLILCDDYKLLKSKGIKEIVTLIKNETLEIKPIEGKSRKDRKYYK